MASSASDPIIAKAGESSASVSIKAVNTFVGGGEDFISFDFPDESFEDDKEEGELPSTSNRQKETGNSPHKRKRDDEDRSHNRSVRSRVNAATTRSTPWMHYVEWDDCKNAAEHSGCQAITPEV